MRDNTFELTEDLIKLLRASWVNKQLIEDDYPGGAQINQSKPYGNRDVANDIAEIIGGIEIDENGEMSEEDEDRCRALHRQTPTALQIVLSTGLFWPGTYRRITPYGKDWCLDA